MISHDETTQNIWKLFHHKFFNLILSIKIDLFEIEPD